jgi:hypothetical protein
MYPTCPRCGLLFEREPGYWLGALYVNYTLGVAALLPVIALMFLFGCSELSVMVVSLLELIVLAPLIVRYSRLIWMYVDQAINPR